MADFSILGGSETKTEAFGKAANSIGTAITAGSANTKGSWVELIASTGHDYSLIYLTVRTDTVADIIFDVGIGAAASEQVVASNLAVAFATGTTRYTSLVTLPLQVPVGTRISVRSQSDTGSTVFLISGLGVSTGFINTPGLAKIVDYGINTGTTAGTVIDPGAVSNTKGSWVEITSSTTEDLKEIFMTVGLRSNTLPAGTGFYFDIGVGAAASEQIIIPDIWFYSITQDFIGPYFYRFPVQIPKGSRIAVRSQAFTTDATDRLLEAFIYGGV